jgi:hypothetical protein
MGFGFLERWGLERRGSERRRARRGPGTVVPSGAPNPGTLDEMLSECVMLREQASDTGLVLDDSAASLQALDQLLPGWRDDPDPEAAEWLGHDAGLYLGTVIVRTVAGARWRQLPDGRPVVVLESGRELDVVAMGQGWSTEGSPELSAVYTELNSG